MDNNLMGFYTKKQYEGFKDKILKYIEENYGKSEAEIGRKARENANRIGVPRALVKPIIDELKKEAEEKGGSLFIVKIEEKSEEEKEQEANNRREKLRENFVEGLRAYDEEMARRNTSSQLVRDLNKRNNMAKGRND